MKREETRKKMEINNKIAIKLKNKETITGRIKYVDSKGNVVLSDGNIEGKEVDEIIIRGDAISKVINK